MNIVDGYSRQHEPLKQLAAITNEDKSKESGKEGHSDDLSNLSDTSKMTPGGLSSQAELAADDSVTAEGETANVKKPITSLSNANYRDTRLPRGERIPDRRFADSTTESKLDEGKTDPDGRSFDSSDDEDSDSKLSSLETSVYHETSIFDSYYCNPAAQREEKINNASSSSDDESISELSDPEPQTYCKSEIDDKQFNPLFDYCSSCTSSNETINNIPSGSDDGEGLATRATPAENESAPLVTG